MSPGCDLHILLYLEYYFCAGTDAGSEKDPAGCSFLGGRPEVSYDAEEFLKKNRHLMV